MSRSSVSEGSGRAPHLTTTRAGSDTPTYDLQVRGMDCASCASAVEASLRKLEGVDDVRVDAIGGRVRVRYAESKIARADLTGAIERVGYRVEDGDERRASFLVDGMDCADEVRLIENALGQRPGIEKLDFDLMRRRLVVHGSIAAAEIQRAVKAVGLTARPLTQAVAPASFWERRGRLVATATAGVALGLALLVGVLGAPAVGGTALLVIATFAGGWFVVPRGLRAARSGTLDMNFLMSVAAAGAWVIGEPTEAAATLFLFAVAELLETFSMDRARNAIKALMELSPAEATVVRNGEEERVPANEVVVGETVIVRPGEKIPVDGEVTGGRSSVNQAPITGESMPVGKEQGHGVFAGSLNGQGVLEIRATKEASDTTIARIIHAVEEAQASRAPSQTFVDRFARVYTPIVVVLALLIAVVPPLAGFGTWEAWVYRALAMLVVACPCALVISTPVTIVSGLTGAARAGVLIKGGVHLENAGRVTTVAFDKTGTLTRGEPTVTDVVALSGSTEEHLLSLTLGVERHSEHPLARAIVAHARRKDIAAPGSVDFEALVGRGARANVAGGDVAIGNERLAVERGADIAPAREYLRRFEREGKTTILVLRERAVVGVIAIADQARAEAARALTDLARAGVRRTVMLTGDNAGTARAVAESIGLTEYHAGLLPDDKVRLVREFEARGERVAFVGDGVNDAPALAAATIGVAMGVAGSDVALETADVALMSDDLTKLALAMRMSRKTLDIIRQNIWFSIAIKSVFLVLAAAGWATLWMAVAADMGASLIVVANGLRARRA